MTPRRDLPSGTVTLLFTDIEGSTKLLHELGADGYSEALAEHRRLLRATFARHGGVEVDTQGDAFFVAFPTAPGAVRAAAEAVEGLASGPIRVRMGIHSGTPRLTDEGYVGEDVNKGARIAAAGHGGQVLLSKETRERVLVTSTDLGEHRLKDFAEPVWIFQLGEERFPPLRTISNTNLPRPASSFVGRGKEVEDVASLMQNGARLITLTGPGGSGKTRLAIEVAATLLPEFKAGVFWVGLAPLRDPALVAETIARTLGTKDGLAGHIAERELLLLLDNLEQVVAAAPELAALVETCPNLKLLVTSRELLRVKGEVEYPVLPLAGPEAVALFCGRARTEPNETVHELCRALDNLPLALELAAARTGVLTPTQILERLSTRLDLFKGGRDTDPRQQTLRATISWSYDLLSKEEQALFVRLAVFAGGCTLEAAEEVAEAGLDTLQSLVDKSLLRHTPGRFWMLETIREYAAEGLERSVETEALRRRHAHYFLGLAEEAELHIRGPSPKEWLDRLDDQHANIRAALDWLEGSGESELTLRLAGAVWWFWSKRSHVVEGRRRLESALTADERPTAARAKALNGAADLAIDGGDPATAILRADEALALNRSLKDPWGAAYALLNLGLATEDQGDIATAHQFYDESVRLFREVGDEYYTLWATRGLAWASNEIGDRARARALYEDHLRRARALGDESNEMHSLGQLAMIAVDEGRIDEALSMATESLRINRDFANVLQTAVYLCRSAKALAFAGKARTATRLLSWSEAQYKERGASPRRFLEQLNEGTLTAIHAQLDEAAFSDAWEQGRALTPDEAVALALSAGD
jgi:predicted ATPase/class 3 adenylate cyclase